MKILFLDIDGVLNSARTAVATGGYPGDLREMDRFDPIAIQLVQKLCFAGDVKIVLSSAWRIMFDYKDVGAALGLPIIDATPRFAGPRGAEIKYWLDDHPEVELYAIVDDDADMLEEQIPRFVRTSGDDGLTFREFRKLCDLFETNPYEVGARGRNWQDDEMHRDAEAG